MRCAHAHTCTYTYTYTAHTRTQLIRTRTLPVALPVQRDAMVASGTSAAPTSDEITDGPAAIQPDDGVDDDEEEHERDDDGPRRSARTPRRGEASYGSGRGRFRGRRPASPGTAEASAVAPDATGQSPRTCTCTRRAAPRGVHGPPRRHPRGITARARSLLFLLLSRTITHLRIPELATFASNDSERPRLAKSPVTSSPDHRPSVVP